MALLQDVLIGIELECLLPTNHEVFTVPFSYGRYSSVSDYWAAHTDASINDTRLWIPGQQSLSPKDICSFNTAHRYLLQENAPVWHKDIKWRPIELSTQNSNGDVIRLSELPAAMIDLQNLLHISDPTSDWRTNIQINSSCGAHLHLSIEQQCPLGAGTFNLARIGYLRWMQQNRPLDKTKLFEHLYRRSGYANPQRAGIMGQDRTDFCLNLGVEWRGFHLNGCDSIQDMRERVTVAFNEFLKAYELSSASKVFVYNSIQLPKLAHVENKVFHIIDPFPSELPCAI